MSRAIGVFLYLPPGLDGLEIQAQGLVRNAVTTSVALASEARQPVIVLVPRTFRSRVEDAIISICPAGVQRPKVVSPRGSSPAGRLATFLHRRQRSRTHESRRQRLKARLARLLSAMGQWALTGWWRVTITGVLAVALILATISFTLWMAWMIPPRLVVVAVGLAGILAIIGWLMRRKNGSLRRLVTRSSRKRSKGRSSIGTALERADVRHLVRRANRCRVSVWWCPSTLFGDIDLLKAPCVSTFADFSPTEFPLMVLDEPRYLARKREMLRAIDASSVVVCLSEHVRDRHLALLDAAAVARSVVIPPGPPTRGPWQESSWDERRYHEAPHVSELIGSLMPFSRAATREWWDFDVITAPTQSRAYKNLRSLVTAVRILYVVHGIRVRLVLTAQPVDEGLTDYIERERCSPFVEFLPNLPDQALDAVLAASSLGITPSLFEGSLPYTLFESVSVGTPCLMADIPVTRSASAHDQRFQELTFFDPYDPDAIAEAIQQALMRLPELLACQRGFLEQRLVGHGWKQTAARYLEAFAVAAGGAERQ